MGRLKNCAANYERRGGRRGGNNDAAESVIRVHFRHQDRRFGKRFFGERNVSNGTANPLIANATAKKNLPESIHVPNHSRNPTIICALRALATTGRFVAPAVSAGGRIETGEFSLVNPNPAATMRELITDLPDKTESRPNIQPLNRVALRF